MNNAWRIFGIIAAFIFVFLFGAVIGGSSMVLYSRARFQQFQSQRVREQAERQREQVLRQEERQRETAQAQQLSQQIASLRQQLQQQQQGRNGGMAQRRGPMAPEQFGPHLMQVFANRLELTPDQQQQVHTLVFQTAEELRRLSRDAGHQSQVAIEHLEDQISALLTQAQRDRFSQMIERSRENFQKWSEQQQQWRVQQRLEQQGWRQGQRQGQGMPGNRPPAPAAPANPAPATAPASPSAPAAPPPAAAPATPSAHP